VFLSRVTQGGGSLSQPVPSRGHSIPEPDSILGARIVSLKACAETTARPRVMMGTERVRGGTRGRAIQARLPRENDRAFGSARAADLLRVETKGATGARLFLLDGVTQSPQWWEIGNEAVSGAVISRPRPVCYFWEAALRNPDMFYSQKVRICLLCQTTGLAREDSQSHCHSASYISLAVLASASSLPLSAPVSSWTLTPLE